MSLEELKREVGTWSDQEVARCYAEEMGKVKQTLQWDRQGRQGNRPCAYPNTLLMNLCSRELEGRGLPLPGVRLSEDVK